ncbi:PEP-utilizing enzyme, TIM barrel domain protein [Streptococcus sp. 27098_8_22]|uniref:putative PEP-binding protein n=1 Tax=Streptococcus sp. 27098_8_22 TaxID=3003665 RepID=UPI00352D1180
MRNQLALSGEQIVEKVYPQLFHYIGMIRGEYLLREINQNILLPNCQQFVKDYLETICHLYSDEEVWYRFSELTNAEANSLDGTKEYFDERHPLFGYRGTRRLLACLDEFQAEAHVVTEVYQTNPNLSVIFPFVNDAEQLKQAIRVLRQHGFTGKVGTMIELPSAYFDLDRVLETGISKIVVGMNDLTSFVFATVRNSQWHDMESPIMLQMLRQMQDKARMKKIDFAVAGYLNPSFIQKMNQMDIKCIIHYSSIPEIFNLKIDHPDHLKRVKEESKKYKGATYDTSRNVECLQANQPLYRR